MKTKIEQYGNRLSRLKMIMFADDTDWKEEVEILLEMLVEDRIEVLRRKQEITGGVDMGQQTK